ncbi:MAG TPA: TolC family protein [Acidobacteriota bacterium]
MNRNILLPLMLLLCFADLLGADQPAQVFRRYFRNVDIPQITSGPNALAALAPAGGALSMSEQTAIELALQSNIDINVERHSRWIALEDLRRQRAPFDPVGRFNVLLDRLTSPTTSVLAGGKEVTEIRTTYDLDYRQDFPAGGGFEVRGGGNRFRTTNTFFNLIPAIGTNFEVILRQQLLQGFGAVPATYRLRIARNNVTVSEEEFRRKASDVILQVQDRYWELAFAGEDLQVKQKSLDLANTVLKQNRDRLQVGTAARLEVIQSEAEVAARQEEFIRTQYNYRRVQDQLVKLISNFQDPREFQAEIRPASPVELPGATGNDFKQLFEIARQNRPELKQAELDVANQRIQFELTQNRLKPRLDLQASYKQVGLGGNLLLRDFSGGLFNAPIIGVTPGGLAESLRQLFGGDFKGYTVGFNLQFPIFNHEARADNATAGLELSRAEMRRASLFQAVALEVRDALTQMDSNRARLQAAQAAARFARERYEGEQVRFEVGTATTRDLIEAQRDLVAAESSEVRAKIDLIKSHSVLQRATGETFAAHRIDLQQTLAQNVNP